MAGGVGIVENLYVGGYSQHANGLVRTNARFQTSERHPMGHYSPGECVFEIDPTWTQTELQNFFNTSNVTWNADTTAPGGYCIQIDSNPSVASIAYGSGFPLIPVDTNDIFYCEVWLRNDPGYVGPGHYMGSVDISASGTSLGGNPGSFGYWVMSNTAASTTWTKYTGYITGFGTAVGQFAANTKYFSPMALFNYSFTSGTRRSFISGWRYTRVYKAGRRKYGDFLAFSTATGLTATGSNQGTALAITADVNNVTTTPVSSGVILPFWQTGHRIVIRNGGVNNLTVYPNIGAQINSAGSNVGFTITTGGTLEFICMTATQWVTVSATYA